MKDSEKKLAHDRLNQQRMAFQNKYIEMQKKLGERRQLLLRDFDNKFRTAIEKVASAKQLVLVLQKENTLYFNKANFSDITNEVKMQLSKLTQKVPQQQQTKKLLPAATKN